MRSKTRLGAHEGGGGRDRKSYGYRVHARTPPTRSAAKAMPAPLDVEMVRRATVTQPTTGLELGWDGGRGWGWGVC